MLVKVWNPQRSLENVASALCGVELAPESCFQLDTWGGAMFSQRINQSFI